MRGSRPYPNMAAVRALPREERELMIAANNGHVLAFDNLSGLSPWLSDALCRLASGGSFAVRRLYTDDEEVLLKAARPTLLNGIEDIIGRSDLADRAIFLTLEPIGEEQRRSETELWWEFEVARPRILGALLDAAAHGLGAVGSPRLGRLPRMADSWTGSAADLLRISAERAVRQATSSGGPRIRAPSPATWDGRRPFFGRTASRLPSVEKAEPETG
jgi:hypothetical protein